MGRARSGRGTQGLRLAALRMMRVLNDRAVVALGLWLIAINSPEISSASLANAMPDAAGEGLKVAAAALPNSATLLETGVTPVIPDGPVVKKFKKLQAKKKLDQ